MASDSIGGTAYPAPPEKESDVRRRLPGDCEDHKPGALAATRGRIKELNKFNQRQTLSHGYLNASLLSANASQLQIIIQSGMPGAMYYMQMCLLILSIILQVVQAVLLMRKYQINMETANDGDPTDDEKDNRRAHKFNNWAASVSVVIMAVNVLISSWGASLHLGAQKANFKAA